MTPGRAEGALLLGATFVVAVSGLAYELIAGAAASYLLGDSVTQFSLVVGVFMTAMGLGAWVSRWIDRPEDAFCMAQLALGVIGGFSAPLFYLSWLHVEPFEAVLFGVVIATGVLSGLEIPLIVRVLERRGLTRHTVSNVLTADYAGALAAAVLFPLVIAPWLGLLSSSLLFGLLNLGVALLAIWLLAPERRRRMNAIAAAAIVVSAVGLMRGESLIQAAEAGLYEDEIVHARTTPYQRIVVTKFRDRTRLFLDGSIQFDSRDEYRYHEALVHPAMTRAEKVDRVLVLGGGDGMAAREALRYPISSLTLVDLDPAVTALFAAEPLAALNDDALRDPRVRVVNADAWAWAQDWSAGDHAPYDVIIADLPDPRSLALSKLYTRAFYTRLADMLNAGGALAVQAGAPFYATEAYWSVIETLETTRSPFGLKATLPVTPYALWVPSFGLWGFALAGPAAESATRRAPPEGLRFYGEAQWPAMAQFPPDIARRAVEANTIRDHALLRYYEAGWRRAFP